LPYILDHKVANPGTSAQKSQPFMIVSNQTVRVDMVSTREFAKSVTPI